MKAKVIQKSGSLVHEDAQIGNRVVIWHGAQIAKMAKVGDGTIIGNNVYIDTEVVIGKRCKIQSGASLFRGVSIGDGVFIGPHVCFTNDKYPRATDSRGKLKKGEDWHIAKTRVMKGSSIGANSTIMAGVKIGKYAMVGAGSVVTKNVPDFALVFGNPAEKVGYVDKEGRRRDKFGQNKKV